MGSIIISLAVGQNALPHPFAWDRVSRGIMGANFANIFKINEKTVLKMCRFYSNGKMHGDFLRTR